MSKITIPKIPSIGPRSGPKIPPEQYPRAAPVAPRRTPIAPPPRVLPKPKPGVRVAAVSVSPSMSDYKKVAKKPMGASRA